MGCYWQSLQELGQWALLFKGAAVPVPRLLLLMLLVDDVGSTAASGTWPLLSKGLTPLISKGLVLLI